MVVELGKNVPGRSNYPFRGAVFLIKMFSATSKVGSVQAVALSTTTRSKTSTLKLLLL